MTPAAAQLELREAPLVALREGADAVARTGYDMAQRFLRGGRLFVFGTGQSATDAQHVAVEFVHPVIVGKRALPAVNLTGDVATLTAVAVAGGLGQVFAHQLRQLASAADIALGISIGGGDETILGGLHAAKRLGMLTVALLGEQTTLSPGPSVDHRLALPSPDPLVVKEAQVTTYHILWELVHVFLERFQGRAR